MEALFVSTGLVALAEIGDKTQLLAFYSPHVLKNPCLSLPAFWSPLW